MTKIPMLYLISKGYPLVTTPIDSGDDFLLQWGKGGGGGEERVGGVRPDPWPKILGDIVITFPSIINIKGNMLSRI